MERVEELKSLDLSRCAWACVVLEVRKRKGRGRIWMFPKIMVPQHGWFIMENPIKMDDLGLPLFSETSI